MEDIHNISDEEIRSLIKHFSESTFNTVSVDSTSEKIMQNCILLANLDYEIELVMNNGDMCPQYPNHIILFLKEKFIQKTEDSCKTKCDLSNFKTKVLEANIARCRERFPVPVLFCQGRYICRSATLSNTAEVCARQGLKYFYFKKSNEELDAMEKEILEKLSKYKKEEPTGSPKYWNFVDYLKDAREKDIVLLNYLQVEVIGDLMVENKKSKFGFYVSSSEKVDKENRYADFTIVSIPYPGCEFFQELRKHNYDSDNLFYNWDQSFIDAEISADELSTDIGAKMQVKWRDYKDWNLTAITQNYIRLILRYLTEGKNNVLIHCISGWDRTPLFISLLRLSLWADGLVHPSLTPHQILYFTIAYDWYLFGHNLRDRVVKSEEIFYFCFNFLKHLVDDNYSMLKKNSSNESYDISEYGDNAQLSDPQLVGSHQSSYNQNGSRDSQDNLHPQFFSNDDEFINGNLIATSPSRDTVTNGSPRSPLPMSERTRASNRTSPLSVTNNRTPPPQLSTTTKRTSPIPINMPHNCGSRPLRSRTESNSSDSSGFCIVTQTGSVSSSISQGQGIENASNHASTNTLIEENFKSRRKENLDKVREIAISAYSLMVGLSPL